jgi:hypothetical protein
MPPFLPTVASYGLLWHLPAVASYGLFWHLLFQLSRLLISPYLLGRYSHVYAQLSNGNTSFWNASIVSTVHAIVLSYLALRAAIDGEFWHSWPHLSLQRTSPQSHHTLEIMTGYMVADLLAVLYYRKEAPWNKGLVFTVLHHSSVIVVNIFLMAGDFGHSWAMIGATLELTTPLVNNRWFLATAQEQHTALYLCNGVGLVLVWFVVRIVVAGPGSLYPLWLNEEDTPVSVKITFWLTYGLLYPLQVVWFRKLVNGAMKALRTASAGGKKD